MRRLRRLWCRLVGHRDREVARQVPIRHLTRTVSYQRCDRCGRTTDAHLTGARQHPRARGAAA